MLKTGKLYKYIYPEIQNYRLFVILSYLTVVFLVFSVRFEKMDTEMDNLSQYETNVTLEDGSQIYYGRCTRKTRKPALLLFTVSPARPNTYASAIPKKPPRWKACVISARWIMPLLSL